MEIFVFGSNLAGRHGKGAALFALKKHGAIYGKGFGLQGNSFAIPTKDANLRTLPLDMIETYVEKFLEHAAQNPTNSYHLTPIGTGLAGYKKFEILNLFLKYRISDNVYFTKTWFQS